MKKNVLIIVTDQQRKDSLGCYGNTYINTPNIDRLANEGICFNSCYVANPICMPNRMSIFTGMYPRNHQLWTNGVLLHNELPNIPMELANHGYETASFGKLHFTPTGSDKDTWESKDKWKRIGSDINWNGPYWGFQHVEMTLGHESAPIAHYGKWFKENGGLEEMLTLNPVSGSEQSGVREISKELHESSFIGDRVSAFIKNERDKEKPFFVFASFPDPHHPFNPPKKSADKYGVEGVMEPVGSMEDLLTRPSHYKSHYEGAWHRMGEIDKKHPNGLSKEHELERIAHTYAMVDLIDENVGKMIDVLDKEGILDETIIIFTSDHGELLGDHGLWLKGPFYYEGLVNVPLIIYSKDQLNARCTNQLISSIDLYPTLFDMLDLPIPKYVNGISQKGLLMKDTQIRDRCLIEYRNGFGDNDCSSKAIITKRYKYIHYQTGEVELTDLEIDPCEKRNVAYDDNYKECVQELLSMMLEEILATETKYPEQISFA